MTMDISLVEAAIAHSPDGFFLGEPDGRFVFVNEALCAMTGYSREQLLALTVRDLVPPCGTETLFDRVAADGPGTRRGQIKHADGTLLPVEIRSFPVKLEERTLIMGACHDLTATLAQEEIQEEQNAISANICENSSDAVIIHDQEGRLLRVNRRAMALFGFTQEDGDGCSVQDLHPPSDYYRAAIFHEQLDKEGRVTFQALGQRRDGSIFPGEITLTRIDLPGRSLVQIICRDLSAAREAETRYRGLFDFAPVSLWEEDLSGVKKLLERWSDAMDGDLEGYFASHPEAGMQCARAVRILDVNQASVRLHGAPSKAHLQEGLERTFTDESTKAFIKEILFLARGEGSTSLEGRVKRFDGAMLDVLVTVFIVPGHEKNWDRVLVALTDITRTKTHERRLEGAQQMAGIVRWEWVHRTGDLIWASGAAHRLGFGHGYMPKTHAEYLAAVPDPNRREVQEGFASHLDSDQPLDMIHPLQLTDTQGEPCLGHFHVRCVTDRDPQGRPLRSLGTMQDVTAEVLEDERKQRQQRKLEHFQRLESLGVLAGGIAHDFNNLLTAIMGYASLARADGQNAVAYSAHLDAIEEASGKAADLCRQMLAYAGKSRSESEILDISRLVRDMIHLLEVSLNPGIRLDVSLPKGLPAVRGDASQLQQVIMNLVTNANEAIQDGRGTIRVVTEECLDPAPLPQEALLQPNASPGGSFVMLKVEDNGSGMSDEVRRQIFEPFYTTKFTGRGLGISAVLGIVRSHHGGLHLESEPDRGTTFTLALPAATESPDSDVPAPPPAPDTIRAQGTVLVVDDEDPVRDLACEVLARAGFKTLSARDGQEALDILQEDPARIDCVLLDQSMPRLDGIQTLLAMRRLRPDLMIILSSGYTRNRVAQALADSPPSAFLQKPYSMATLLTVVVDLLS